MKYTSILECLNSPEDSYPPIELSLAYPIDNLHLLAEPSLM